MNQIASAEVPGFERTIVPLDGETRSFGRLSAGRRLAFLREKLGP